MSNSDIPSGPLSGVRVLDLTRVLAGPYCTMVLADLGAEVVKVERPEIGDDARHFGPFLPSGLSAYFASLNRGKKSITLDLKSEEGKQALLRLTAKADVLVENFRPGTMEGLGLGPDDLQAVHPQLIYASVSGFGKTGHYARRPAYDVIIQAMSGLMSITGTDARHPVRVGTSISDIVSGLFGAIGILAELQRRDPTDRGGVLDVAMLDCSVAVLENALCRYDVSGKVPEPQGTRHPSITPFQAFTTSDGEIVIAAGNDLLWKKFCAVLNDTALADDPRFDDNHSRTENRDELEQELNHRLVLRSSDNWLAELEEAGVPCASIRDMADVMNDQHLHERGMLHEMQDHQGQAFHTAGSPLHSRELSRHAPQLGEHTDKVLEQWLSDDD